MSNYIIGTCGHIDHGKTALIKALNGYEGDTTKEEKDRGITIDLSFSHISQNEKNVAFIDVPGHEKLIKNMIAGAFSFDCVMVVVSAAEGIKPQTIEHLEILKLIGIKKALVVITKKDLVDEETLKIKEKEIVSFVQEYEFDIEKSFCVSIYDEASIAHLKEELFTLNASTKEKENFFRYYVDRVFSSKGAGTIVTGTVLGNEISVNEKIYLCDIKKEVKIKNLQVHSHDVETAFISNRCAINLSGVDTNKIQRGSVLSKKGFLRGFFSIDVSFKALKGLSLTHNRIYTIYLGAKKFEAKVLLFSSTDSLEVGYATIKASSEIFSIYGEKLILREGNRTIAGANILNPVVDPMKKQQKLKMLEALNKQDIKEAYQILLTAHKKGLGLVSSAQRFALSHEEALKIANSLDASFVDEKDLIIYPAETKAYIKEIVSNIYTKNQYALLSIASIKLRLKWASESFILLAINELIEEKLLKKDGNLYINANIKESFQDSLENIVLERLEKEGFTPTAPYNIYDELDLDRKLGDDILKALCAKKHVIRMAHNLFIHAQSLNKIVKSMNEIIKEEGYIEIKNFKEKYPMSRKYLVAYLDYLDNFSQIKKVDNKRCFA
ncbi:MAG: selenocysteine-specific translation elongation factor [Campylobacteraceae bacterium]|nr:selenocysteine-specific translation elongation factor [Campylobacteraceae bacterium]